jgi:hypothetical protein
MPMEWNEINILIQSQAAPQVIVVLRKAFTLWMGNSRLRKGPLPIIYAACRIFLFRNTLLQKSLESRIVSR